MSEQEIKEGNKLIAEFIDLTPHNMFPDELQAPDEFGWMAVKVNVESDFDKLEGKFTSFDDYFEFHSSWDWLMPAINKAIDIIGFKTIDECTDFEWRLFTCICDMKISTPIDIAFHNLIEFIKWYNENNC